MNRSNTTYDKSADTSTSQNTWLFVTSVIEVEERNFGLQANHHNASLSVSHEGNIEEMLADAMREDVDDKLEEVVYIDNTAHEVVSVKGTSDRAVSLESKVQEAMFIEGKNSVLELYNSRENKNLWSVVTHVIEVEERNFGLQANHHNASLSVSHEGNIEEMLADAMREDVDDKLEEVVYIDNTAHEVVSVKGTSDRAVSLESKVQEAMFIEGKNSVLELYNSRENKNLWSVVTHVIEVEERNFGLQANHHNASLSVSHEGNIEEMLADAMREDVDDKLEEVVYIDNTAHEVVSVKGTSDRAVSLESKVQEAMFIEGKNSVLELYNEEKSKTYNATVFLDKYRERNISDTIGDATYDKFDYLNDISMYNDEVIMAEYCQLSESSKRVINQLVKVVTKGVSSGQSNAAMVPVLQDKELNLLKVFKWLNDDINVEYDYRASLQEENLRCAIFKNDKQQFSRIRNEIFMNQQKILQVFDVMKEMTQQYFANNAAICQKMNQIATFQQEIVDNMGTSINNFNALYNKLKTRIFPIMGNYNAEKKQAFINFHNINVRDCFNEQISECYAMSKLLESYKTVDNRLEVQESCAKLNKDINKLIDNITVTNLIVNFSTRKLTTCFAFDLENSSDVGILEFCNFNKYKNRIVWNSRPLLSKSVNAINAFSDQIANMDCNSMLACTRDDAISTPMDQIDNVDCGDVSTRMENIDVRNMQQKQRIVA